MTRNYKCLLGLTILTLIALAPLPVYGCYLLTIIPLLLVGRTYRSDALWAWLACGIYGMQKAWFYGVDKTLTLPAYLEAVSLSQSALLYLYMLVVLCFAMAVLQLLRLKLAEQNSKLSWYIFLFVPILDHMGASLHWPLFRAPEFLDFFGLTLFLGAQICAKQQNRLCGAGCLITAIICCPYLAIIAFFEATYQFVFAKQREMITLAIPCMGLVYAFVFSHWLLLTPYELLHGLTGLFDAVKSTDTQLLLAQYHRWIAAYYSMVGFISAKVICLMITCGIILWSFLKRDTQYMGLLVLTLAFHLTVLMAKENMALLHLAWLFNVILVLDFVIKRGLFRWFATILNHQENDMQAVT